MARTHRQKQTAWLAVGGAHEPNALGIWLRRFLEYLRIKNFSDRTVQHRETDLGDFVVWLGDRSIERIDQVTKPIVESYQKWLFLYRKPNGKPLTFRTQHDRLVQVRIFFKWLSRQHAILANPASDIELPKVERRIPGAVLSTLEIEKILAQPDLSDPLGLRDRVMMEVLYSTGIRRAELGRLALHDVDGERRTVFVRQGKGKRDRIVPIGERALEWLRRYLDEARPTLVMPPDEGYVFLSATGEPLSPDRLTRIVRDCIEAADIGKAGSCHLFRHAMATAMLDNGADIRHIQEILGHAELSTTQIYTHVAIATLQRVHAATHPAATNAREPRAADVVDTRATKDVLLGELADEDAEERDAVA